MMRPIRLLLGCLAALLVVACGSPASATPTIAPTANPTLTPVRASAPPSEAPPTPASTLQAKCATASAEPPYYSLIGWRDGQVVLLQTTSVGCAMASAIVSLDPATDAMQMTATVPGGAEIGAATTDGRSIAVVFADGDDAMRLLILDAADRARIVVPPTGATANPVPLASGGYLLSGSQRLVLVSSDGAIVTNTPLPAGYDTLAPTSDPDRYLLARRSDAERAFGPGPNAPLHLVVWTRGTGSLSPMIAIRAEPATNGLAHVFTAAPTTGSTWTIHGAWWALEPTGRLSLLSTAVGCWSTLAPDGRHLLVVTCVGPNEVTETLTETALPAETTIARYTAPTAVQADSAAWDGERAAVLLQSQLPRTSLPEVLLIDGAHLTRLPLP